MNTVTSAPHENIAAELVRRGLPIEYAERVGTEVADHFGDLMLELRAEGLDEAAAMTQAADRMGDRKSLIKKTVREYQCRFWCGRWPLLTFLIGPVVLLLLTWLTTAILGGCIIWSLNKLGVVVAGEPDGIVSTGDWVLDRAVLVWFLFAAPALVVTICARWARRASLCWPWVMMAACVLALSVGMVKSGFPDPTLRPRSIDGRELPADARVITLGIPMLAPGATPSMLIRTAWNWYTRDLEQTCQFLLPLGVAGILLLRARQLALRSRQLLLDHC